MSRSNVEITEDKMTISYEWLKKTYLNQFKSFSEWWGKYMRILNLRHLSYENLVINCSSLSRTLIAVMDRQLWRLEINSWDRFRQESLVCSQWRPRSAWLSHSDVASRGHFLTRMAGFGPYNFHKYFAEDVWICLRSNFISSNCIVHQLIMTEHFSFLCVVLGQERLFTAQPRCTNFVH